MSRRLPNKIIAAIDVGTTKICVLIAQHLQDDQIEILGVGRSSSEGLKKGVVVDVAKTICSIKDAVVQAEMMAGVAIESVCVGISGGHIKALNSHGVVPIQHGEIRKYDIVSALAAAKAIPVPEGMQILHVLPQYFVIDGRDRVLDPLGMHGIRLEVYAHIIMGAISSVQNLVKCCEMAGVSVNDIILEQLASAQSVLSIDERELGVAVLDIGGGTSDFAIYQQGSIRHTMVLPIAGNHFTQDVAIGLRTTLDEAERIKRIYGFKEHDSEALIEVEMVQGTQKKIVIQQELTTILQSRAEELLFLIAQEIETKSLQHFMPTGLVLTGGGSLLLGMKELANTMFDMPVRVGLPRLALHTPESLNSPIFATGYGLLLQTLKKQYDLNADTMSGPLVKRVFDRMKSWVLDFF